ncbi:DNA-binding response regulator [Candidatus Methylacidiphilum fumarolicum]|uniref:DNA-binding response regulator, NarL family (REC-HTH domains) n=2 Tax=Candidatus Methylacidiphilum fumarolicum TaxID=591154 RepID=I0JW02_METFB|nr:response regulator transcription factor [Candidatus Methylacidiphilum fumarolicum]MBW6415668.1 response regulator transcription factor [Candidatus Methylacidiphilum fumarolicum]TFE66811.1 DNA-binding response regulator [Candidatus Methylacidiphilum fumarolicum]TFE77645.1 DNA-binding response regulator [Candidatus Methylacidiphilum fumarolicum]CAI9086066.1 DNA-binding response regulator, NarL family (REC-HTH domains) [Candidatus Methylacidiphilum fumarolicum]CCG91421.1 DNA-binding response r
MMKERSTETKKRGVLIVDDHAVLREGLAYIIGTDPSLCVCGMAENAQKGFELVEKLKPDIVLVDISLPGKSGLELVKDIHAIYPEIPILVLSMHEESLFAERLLRAGARGYLMKSEGGEKLLQAINRILEGNIFVSDEISSRILEGFTGKKSSPFKASPLGKLSDRELEVFQLIGKGLSSRQIAEQLHLSIKTVEAYRASIKQKLKLQSGTELVHYAISWHQTNISSGQTDF